MKDPIPYRYELEHSSACVSAPGFLRSGSRSSRLRLLQDRGGKFPRFLLGGFRSLPAFGSGFVILLAARPKATAAEPLLSVVQHRTDRAGTQAAAMTGQIIARVCFVDS